MIKQKEKTLRLKTSRGFVEFPMEFVHVLPQEGVVQLVPAFGTSLSGFLPLASVPGIQLFSLQLGDHRNDLGNIVNESSIIDLSERWSRSSGTPS